MVMQMRGGGKERWSLRNEPSLSIYSIMGDDHSLKVFILLSPVTTTTRYHNSNRFHVTIEVIITIFLSYLYRVNKKIILYSTLYQFQACDPVLLQSKKGF